MDNLYNNNEPNFINKLGSKINNWLDESKDTDDVISLLRDILQFLYESRPDSPIYSEPVQIDGTVNASDEKEIKVKGKKLFVQYKVTNQVISVSGFESINDSVFFDSLRIKFNSPNSKGIRIKNNSIISFTPDIKSIYISGGANAPIRYTLLFFDFDYDISHLFPFPFAYYESNQYVYKPALLDSSGNLLVSNTTVESYLSDIKNSIQTIDDLYTGSELPIKDYIDLQTTIRKVREWTTAQSNYSLWTPASGKKFVITDIIISVTADQTVELFDNAATIFGEMSFIASGGIALSFKKPVISSTANNILKLTTSTGNGTCFINGYEI